MHLLLKCKTKHNLLARVSPVSNDKTGSHACFFLWVVFYLKVSFAWLCDEPPPNTAKQNRLSTESTAHSICGDQKGCYFSSILWSQETPMSCLLHECSTISKLSVATRLGHPPTSGQQLTYLQETGFQQNMRKSQDTTSITCGNLTVLARFI